MANQPVAPAIEPDFSWRKIKIATVCLIGSTFATSLLPLGTLGLVMIPMTTEFGWSRTEFSLATTFLMWSGAVSLPIAGRLTDRLGARPVILGGTVIVGLITLTMALQTSSLLQFYLTYGLLGTVGASAFSYSKIVAALFTQHRGKALAIFSAESAVAAAIIPTITNTLLSHYGWRGLYTWYGLIILAVMPLLYFVLEEPGREFRPRQAEAPPAFLLEGMTAREAMHDRIFWMIVAASLLGGAPALGMMTHFVPAIVAKGFSQATAANIMSGSMLLGVVGPLLGGWLVDKVQTSRIYVPFLLCSTLAWLALWMASAQFGGVPLLLVSAALSGIAFNAARPMGSYFHTRYFGLRAFAEIYGIQMGILALAMGFAPPLVGLIYDRTHSYNLAFEIIVVCGLACAAIYLFLGPYRYEAKPGAALPEPEPESPLAAPAE